MSPASLLGYVHLGCLWEKKSTKQNSFIAVTQSDQISQMFSDINP